MESLPTYFQDLENYIRNHPEARLTRIQEICLALEGDGVMGKTVKAEAAAATSRWNQLSQQVRKCVILFSCHKEEYQMLVLLLV